MSVADVPARPRPTAGVDWAKDDHAVAIVDADGEPIDRFPVAHDVAGLRTMVRRLRAAEVDQVGIERPDGPVVDALRAAGLTVLVIPPGQLKNLRSRYGSAGNKDDRFDAYVLADVVRTDRRRLRPLLVDAPATTALRQATRARKDLVAHRLAVANQLRAHLQIVLPGAVDLFADIDSQISLRFLQRFPTQARADWLSPKRMATWLSSVGYSGRTDPTVLHTRLTGAPTGATGDAGEHAATVTLAFIAVLPTLTSQIEALAAGIAEQLHRHPDAPIFTSLPRSGTVRAARLLAEIGDARGRFPTPESLACLAGVAPPPASPARSKSSASGGAPTNNSATPSATSPATAAAPTPGPTTSTSKPAPEATTTPTPPASSPAPGSTSSGTAGRPTRPTTRPTTAPSNASSNKINKRRLDTGLLMPGASRWPG